MNKLNFINIKENKIDNKKIKKIYKEAFPKNERIPIFILKLLAGNNKADFLAIYDKEKLIGLIYNTYYKDILYIFYLAIDSNLRGNGYGSYILDYIKEKYNNYRIILNIEEIDTSAKNHEQRLKRKIFYQKNGFKEAGYTIKELNIVYEIMYYNKDNKKVNKEEYFDLLKNYWGDLLYKLAYRKINK